MAWQTRPIKRPLPPQEELVPAAPRRKSAALLAAAGAVTFQASARGLYRVFHAATYRFYRSNTGTPPLSDADGGTPYATSTTLPATPVTTFADGTWLVAVSYFDGVLDSGFLPLGPKGETYLTLIVSGGVIQPALPSTPGTAVLVARAGGVVRITAAYAPSLDGANAADHWAIAYTTNGTTPAVNTPTITAAIGESLAYLLHDLPAQVDGTTVKVCLQVRRLISVGVYAYSPALQLSTTAAVTGPSASLAIASWAGDLQPGST